MRKEDEDGQNCRGDADDDGIDHDGCDSPDPMVLQTAVMSDSVSGPLINADVGSNLGSTVWAEACIFRQRLPTLCAVRHGDIHWSDRIVVSAIRAFGSFVACSEVL